MITIGKPHCFIPIYTVQYMHHKNNISVLLWSARTRIPKWYSMRRARTEGSALARSVGLVLQKCSGCSSISAACTAILTTSILSENNCVRFSIAYQGFFRNSVFLIGGGGLKCKGSSLRKNTVLSKSFVGYPICSQTRCNTSNMHS